MRKTTTTTATATRIAAAFALGGVIVALAARATTACGGDPAQANAPIDLPESSTTTPPTTPPTDPDGSNPDADLPLLGSYCQGIVFYASLDTGAFTPEVGTSVPYPYGTTAPSTAGRFGGSVALFADSGPGPADSAAAVYFIRPDGGAPILDDDVGTVSLWYRGTALDDIGVSAVPVIFRPTATIAPNPVVSTGLLLVGLGDRFGLVNSPFNGPTQQLLTFTKARMRPYLRDGEFNHFAAAWRRGDAGGVPTAIMALNGGSGTVYDASFDASYDDASPNDAGDLLVPYRGYTTRNWNIPDASPSLAIRLGGTMQSAPQGEIDDVAIWNRVLTFEEVEGIYKAAKPLHELCRLK